MYSGLCDENELGTACPVVAGSVVEFTIGKSEQVTKGEAGRNVCAVPDDARRDGERCER